MSAYEDGSHPLVLSDCPEQVRTNGRVCGCGGPKGYYAQMCRSCRNVVGWPKPLLGVTGEEHPAWKGGQEVDRDGYIRTYAPDHPWPRRNGYVREHVRIAELRLGRRIRQDEVVHHRNHERSDNRPSNLVVMPRGEHSRIHRAVDSKLRKRDSKGRFA